MKHKKDIIAVLHNIRSIHNVASIFRTADAAGVVAIYLSGITPGPLDRFGAVRPQFTKVSLGAERMVRWEKLDAKRALRKLKNEGYKIFAVEQASNSIPYYKSNVSARSGSLPVRQAGASGGKGQASKVALILGNERVGLPRSILKVADAILEIPMRGAMVRHAHHPRRLGLGKESLNVSVAFGIIVFSLVHHR